MKTKMIIFSILISGIILLIWSTTGMDSNYKHIKDPVLKDVFILNSSPTFEGYYYKGTIDDFHFFVGKWKYQKEKHFKISKNDLFINHVTNFGTDEKAISLIGLKDRNEFGHTKYYKIYENFH